MKNPYRVFCKDCVHMRWLLGDGPASCQASPLVVLDPVQGEILARVPCHEKNAGMDCPEFTPKPPPRPPSPPKIPDPPGSGWEGQREGLEEPLGAQTIGAILALAGFLWLLWALFR